MRWRKLGRVFGGEGQFPWMASHAGVPFAEQIDGDLYRIYFTSRDGKGRSHIGWVELDITRPDRLIRVAEAPLLAPGAVGKFDDAGATLSCAVTANGKRYIYYIGWSLRQNVPYHLAIGLAVGEAGGSAPVVERLPGPIMERNVVDPLFCTAPSVLTEDGRWRMWYVSGLGWSDVGGRKVPSYCTRHAASEDGVDWQRDGLAVLDPGKHEFGFSRPSILRDGLSYLMWYSVRGRNRPYQLGFAQSRDGLRWTRDDAAAGLEPSAEGWDSEMIAYPHVFNHRAERYMLYNGNGFGKSGFGLAVQY